MLGTKAGPQAEGHMLIIEYEGRHAFQSKAESLCRGAFGLNMASMLVITPQSVPAHGTCPPWPLVSAAAKRSTMLVGANLEVIAARALVAHKGSGQLVTRSGEHLRRN